MTDAEKRNRDGLARQQHYEPVGTKSPSLSTTIASTSLSSPATSTPMTAPVPVMNTASPPTPPISPPTPAVSPPTPLASLHQDTQRLRVMLCTKTTCWWCSEVFYSMERLTESSTSTTVYINVGSPSQQQIRLTFEDAQGSGEPRSYSLLCDAIRVLADSNKCLNLNLDQNGRIRESTPKNSKMSLKPGGRFLSLEQLIEDQLAHGASSILSSPFVAQTALDLAISGYASLLNSINFHPPNKVFFFEPASGPTEAQIYRPFQQLYPVRASAAESARNAENNGDDMITTVNLLRFSLRELLKIPDLAQDLEQTLMACCKAAQTVTQKNTDTIPQQLLSSVVAPLWNIASHCAAQLPDCHLPDSSLWNIVAASSETPRRKADKWLAKMYQLTNEAIEEMGLSLPPGFVLDVAVLDTGCLDGADRAREFGVFNSHNFCGGSANDVCDNDGHGTHLVGLLLRCPTIVPWQIHALKVSETSDIPEEDQTAISQALRYCMKKEVHMAVMALSVPSPKDELRVALNEATDAGILVVGAAGNHGLNSYVQFPASEAKVFCIWASDASGSWLPLNSWDAGDPSGSFRTLGESVPSLNRHSKSLGSAMITCKTGSSMSTGVMARMQLAVLTFAALGDAAHASGQARLFDRVKRFAGMNTVLTFLATKGYLAPDFLYKRRKTLYDELRGLFPDLK